MKAKRQVEWLGLIVLLLIAVFCTFMVENSFFNALLDVCLAFGGSYVGQKDSNKKYHEIKLRLHELQERMKQMVPVNKDDNLEDKANSIPDVKIDWKHAVKR